MEIITEFWNGIKELFFDFPPFGGIFSVLIIIVILGSTTVVASLIITGVFKLFDTYSRPAEHGFGKVIDKNITKIQQAGVITICSLRSILVDVNGKLSEVTVKHHYYSLIKKGDEVNVTYVTGRFFGDIYVKEIELPWLLAKLGTKFPEQSSQ